MEQQFKVFVNIKYVEKDTVKKLGAKYNPDNKSWYFIFDEDDLLSDILIHIYGYKIKSIEGFIESAQNILREKIERGNVEFLKEKGHRILKLDKLLAFKPVVPVYDFDEENLTSCFESDEDDKPPVSPTAINIPNRVTYS